MPKQATSPYQNSSSRLRAEGYLIWKVEVWNPHTQRKIDMFHLFDLVAIRSDKAGVLGVQVTSRGQLAPHRRTICQSEATDAARVWLEAGNRIQLHGWDQPGGPRTRYRCKTESITLEQLESCPVQEPTT